MACLFKSLLLSHLYHSMYSCHKLSWFPNEEQAGRRNGPQGGFSISLVGNISSTPILRPLAHSTECGDVCHTSTRRFNKVIHSVQGEQHY